MCNKTLLFQALNFVMEDPCWIEGDDAEAGLDYCADCGAKEVTKLKEAGRDAQLDGGMPWSSDCVDTAPYCYKCHKTLAYTFTNYGAEEEAAHYLEHGIPWPLTPEDAYHLTRIEGALGSAKAWEEVNHQ